MKIRNIGIVGKGKMGWDIFSNIYLKDCKIKIVCRSGKDVKVVEEKIEKILKKKLERGMIPIDTYEKRREDIEVSDKMKSLASCDMIIESIIENKKAKKDLFNEISKNVKESTILTSNTSSIPLEEIFSSEKKSSRCFGLHFFYPIKLSNIIEINIMKNYNEECLETLETFIYSIGKKHIKLFEDGHFLLNKILLNMMAQTYKIYRNSGRSMEEIDLIVKKDIAALGMFEMMNSIGSVIAVELIENLKDERNKEILEPFAEWLNDIVEKGYSGINFVKNIYSINKEERGKCIDREQFRKQSTINLLSLLCNEINYAVSKNYTTEEQIVYSLSQIVGLKRNPREYAKSFGRESVYKCLNDNYRETNCLVYKPMDM